MKDSTSDSYPFFMTITVMVINSGMHQDNGKVGYIPPENVEKVVGDSDDLLPCVQTTILNDQA